MFKLSTDEFMMERMADSYSMMDDEEKENWSMDAARAWIADENKYARDHGKMQLKWDVEDVYGTIAALIEGD